LSQLGVPHTQNFEISLKNSGVKKFENHFWKFSIKKAFGKLYSELISDLENSEFS
jgi:hypothetical protein